MNPYEIPDDVTNMMMDVVTVRYADDLERGIKVAQALQRISTFMKNEFHNSPECVDAIEIMGEIITEMKRRIREKHERKQDS